MTEDGDERPIGPERAEVGPVWRRIYKPNAGKHGAVERGGIGREPRDGQEALDFSAAVKPTSAVRIGIDYEERVFVVLRYSWGAAAPKPNGETYHGYVVPWGLLTQEMRNVLIRSGMATRAGKIL